MCKIVLPCVGRFFKSANFFRMLLFRYLPDLLAPPRLTHLPSSAARAPTPAQCRRAARAPAPRARGATRSRCHLQTANRCARHRARVCHANRCARRRARACHLPRTLARVATPVIVIVIVIHFSVRPKRSFEPTARNRFSVCWPLFQDFQLFRMNSQTFRALTRLTTARALLRVPAY